MSKCDREVSIMRTPWPIGGGACRNMNIFEMKVLILVNTILTGYMPSFLAFSFAGISCSFMVGKWEMSSVRDVNTSKLILG